ncbi:MULTISPECIES: CrcB family protein [Bacillaceae]|nr:MULTISPECIES: CrcB family protein [Bacillaceae]
MIEKNNKVKKKAIWAIGGLLFGAGAGAILGIIAYNQQWLG